MIPYLNVAQEKTWYAKRRKKVSLKKKRKETLTVGRIQTPFIDFFFFEDLKKKKFQCQVARTIFQCRNKTTFLFLFSSCVPFQWFYPVDSSIHLNGKQNGVWENTNSFELKCVWKVFVFCILKVKNESVFADSASLVDMFRKFIKNCWFDFFSVWEGSTTSSSYKLIKTIFFFRWGHHIIIIKT